MGIDPQKTYMGGGYKKEDIYLHDIVIEGKAIRALCNVKNDYSDTKYFHLTQPATYSCSSQLLVSYFAHSREIGRQAKGFHIFLSNYSTEWKKVIKSSKNIPVEVKEVRAAKKHRSETVKFKVNFVNNSLKANYTVVFRLPIKKKS